MPIMATGALEELFGSLNCEGWLCALPVDGPGEVSLHADELVAPASVFKVWIGLEAQCQIESGELDARERIRWGTANRTPGPTGFSTFSDDVEVSLRDLVRIMLTRSGRS
jgi:beta-lactamase class A